MTTPLAIRRAPVVGALYGEWQRSDATAWGLRLGVRVESDFHSLVAVDPRLALSRQVAPGTRLSIGYGRAHQVVQSLLNEDNVGSAVIGPTLPVAAGPDGPVARSEQWTAGVDQRLGRRARLVIEGYRRDWKDVVSPAVTSSGLYGLAPELGDGHAEGVVATAALGTGRIDLQASVGLGHGTQRVGATSYQTGVARPWSFDGALGYRPGAATLVQLRWTTGAGQYRSAIAPGIEWQPYQPGTGSGEFEGNPTNLPGAINALRLQGPLRIDLGLQHSWSLGRGGDGRHAVLLTSLRLHNLLDRSDPIGVMVGPDGAYRWLQGTPRGLIAEVGWRY